MKFLIPPHWSAGDELKVLVIGCGGTGSEMVDALTRMHYCLMELGRPRGLSLYLQDGDQVSAANVGRQRFLHCDVGHYKSRILAERYGLLYGMEIRYLTTYARVRSFRELRKFDLVITCVDRAAFRVALGEYWRRKSCMTLWLDCGNGAQSGQVVLGHLGKPPETPLRLPNVFDLYPSLAGVDDHHEPSCSLEAALRSQMLGINRFMADAAVYSVLMPLLRTGETGVHGAFIDASRPSVQPLRIDPEAWRFLGYKGKGISNPKAGGRRLGPANA